MALCVEDGLGRHDLSCVSPKSKREDLPHVVILGGGFAGLYAARHLYKAPVRVTMVDRHNHHLFQPLLYQVATATLSPSEIAAPLRALLGRHDVSVVLAEVTGVDTVGKRVLLSDGELKYDFLVIATGATHSYFGNDAWAQHAPGLKSIEDAVEIRRRILVAFELAEREPDPEVRRALLNFIIIGAGPTGVELAGSLAEISRHSLPGDFRNIDPREARIILIEGIDRVLPVYPDDLSQKACRTLEKLGVEVRTGARVTHINEQGVFIGTEFIPARTVLWAAGVAASPVARSLGAQLDRAGRVLVTPELTVPGHDDVFVVGDLASLNDADGKPVPGLAPAAMQEGKHAAHNIRRQLQGKPMEAFSYWDRGSYAVIGRGHAVGIAFRRFKQSGFSAWMAWLLIHITFLIGFRSRLAVLLDWAYSYLTFGKSARIITGPSPRLDRLQPTHALTEGGETSAAPESRFQATASHAEPASPVTH
ncbi:pyridine nucleotide-disulfide oxidoreductase [Corallococcus macrosporus DSM 14697]|uniref:NADH:ubiquinone reductase (non-electrogenic) n=1 Tax=Corallococcus macrosporus DSM 14697 TaxID=1189310 RepID=A0A250JPR4_9BACT|nr:pyridine nucleotide-disulfide oxidoreductase [Corallococcus macrosporus DSM 14697]